MPDFESLYRKFMDQSCTQQEQEELFVMIRNGENDERLQIMIEQVTGMQGPELRVDDRRAEEILANLHETMPKQQTRFRYIGWVAAAAVIGGLAILYLLYPGAVTKKQSFYPAIAQVAAPAPDDIAPASSGAVLTLADGKQVTLDSVQKGSIAQQGGTNVSLAGGTLLYNEQQAAAAITYNTLSTPKGKLFHLVLPDGSEVWLNAATAITYPTSFSGGDRVVTLKGEAYFDIKPDAQRPFKVKVNGEEAVRVLGTEFNLNAYEQSHITTLINGSVQVHEQVLKPGKQASVTAAGVQVTTANMSKVLAWRNGIFDFEDADIQTVMKQLERWYDIEVAYENDPPKLRFGGKMDRNLTLSNIIRMLKISGVTCTQEGRTLRIKQ